MMNSKQTLFSLLMCVLAIAGCDTQKQAIVGNELALTRAKQTLDSLYLNYSVSGTCLLRENYPSNIGEYTATYLASEEQKNSPISILIYGPIPELLSRKAYSPQQEIKSTNQYSTIKYW